MQQTSSEGGPEGQDLHPSSKAAQPLSYQITGRKSYGGLDKNRFISDTGLLSESVKVTPAQGPNSLLGSLHRMIRPTTSTTSSNKLILFIHHEDKVKLLSQPFIALLFGYKLNLAFSFPGSQK